jgi:ATP-dependent DNA helicase RecG
MPLLKEYLKYVKETLPEDIIKKYNFISKSKALEKLHFPNSMDDVDIAKYRLAYEELFEINYKSISKKQENFKFSE